MFEDTEGTSPASSYVGMRGVASSAPSASSSSAAVNVPQAKRALRKTMRSTLQALDTQRVASQSEHITEHVVRHKAFAQARSVSIYVSMASGEAHTEALCRHALEQGKRLYVPRFAVAAKSESEQTSSSATASTFDSDMRMLRVTDWADYEAMVMNKWGIREPADLFASKAREDALLQATGGCGLDLILVPGVAFDRWGGRLGHGKGYYDRYIARCAAFAQEHGQSPPVTMALALQEQVLAPPARVPTDPHDEPLDAIISSDGPMDYRAADS